MEPVPLLDCAGRRRSPATLASFHQGHPPRNKGLRYPPDPPTVEEIIVVMRAASDHSDGVRLRGLIIVLWRARWQRPNPADTGARAVVGRRRLPVGDPVAVMALLSLPAVPRAARLRLRWLFDSLIVATSLAFLSWVLVLGPVWKSTDLSTLGGFVALAYPFGDVVMVFFIVFALRRMTGGESTALRFLFAGLLIMALSDSAYSYLTTTNSYASGGLLDVGWIAAY